jgi:hypothetical protein
MSAGAIKAGKAWVELSLQDKAGAGLAAAQRKMMAWGAGLGKVGSIVTAAAGGMLGAIGAAAKMFADAGSEVFDMSQATGVGAEELSALGYAAKQSGASLADVGLAMKGMGKFALALSEGNKEAADTAKKLGINTEAFLASTPEQRLGMIADALQKIEDPGIRSAEAMKLLGKGGTALLPMLKDGANGLRAMTNQARAFGLTMTDDEAKKADALGDAWGLVNDVFKKIVTTIGAAVAPALTTILETTARIGVGIIEFVSNNQAFIVGLAKAAAIAVAVGVGLTALGVALPLVAGALGFLVTPLGATIAALTAGVAYFGFFTESGQSMAGELMKTFGELLNFIKQVAGGIFDALVAGKWELAGKIVVAALKVSWQTGIGGLKLIWVEFKTWLLKLLASIGEALGTVGEWIFGEGFANEIKIGAEMLREEATTDVGKQILKAQTELDGLLAEATKSRADKDHQLQIDLNKGIGTAAKVSPVSTEGAKTQLSAVSSGTFSALAAGQLSDRGNELARVTADNTAAMVALLTRIERDGREQLSWGS